MNMQKIEALPDYPALRQVQNAPWMIGEVHGVAVMAGTGYSRFAYRAANTTPCIQLWSDIQKAVLQEFYSEPRGYA